MAKGKDKLYMKLDGFKKNAEHSTAKLRTMSLFSKIGIIFRFRRIRWGLYASLFFGYLYYIGMHKDPGIDLIITLLFYGIIAVIAFLSFLSGGKKLANMIGIMEYGIAVPATVTSVKEWKVRRSTFAGKFVPFGGYDIYKKGCILCSYTDFSGKSHDFKVYSHREHRINKGDSISIVYDPGMRENVIAVDALPGFVKTNPVL